MWRFHRVPLTGHGHYLSHIRRVTHLAMAWFGKVAVVTATLTHSSPAASHSWKSLLRKAAPARLLVLVFRERGRGMLTPT